MHGRSTTLGFAVGSVFGGLALGIAATAGGPTPASTVPPQLHAPAAQPLAFEENVGQTAKQVRYVARGKGYSLFLTARGAVVSLARSHSAPAVVRTRLLGTARGRARAERRLPGTVNVFEGPRSTWRTNVPTFARVRYDSLYPGISAVYHGTGGQLEYDFQIAAGADPARIRMKLSGQREPLTVAHNGDLLIRVKGGLLREARPLAYQSIGKRRSPVHAAYAVHGNDVSLRLGRYDHSRALLIDPILTYASYVGGSLWDEPLGITTGGPNSDIYVVGETLSNDFPGATARNNTRNDADVFVTAYDSTGKTVVYSTYVGGSQADAVNNYNNLAGNPIAVDGSGNVYVVGTTSSTTDFPSGAYPASASYPAVGSCSSGGSNAFMTELGPTGALAYSTCLGGSSTDEAYGVAVRRTSTALGQLTSIYVVGDTSSGDFPVTTTGDVGFDTSQNGSTDGFLTRVALNVPSGANPNPCTTCASIGYSTFMGGTSADYAYAVTLDSSGVAYVAGRTDSTSWPETMGGSTPFDDEAFAVKVNPLLTSGSFQWGRFIGAHGVDDAKAIALTNSNGTGQVVVGGDSNLSTGFPGYSTGGAQPVTSDSGNSYDFFVTRLSSDGTSVVGTDFIGGTGDDYLSDMAFHAGAAGGGYSLTLIGYMFPPIDISSSPVHTVNPITGQTCQTSSKQVLLVKYNPNAVPKASYATCLGATATDDVGTGVVVDSSARAWITGLTGGGFPTTPDAQQSSYGGGTGDGFLARVDPVNPPTITSGAADVIGTGDATFTWTDDSTDVLFAYTSEASGHLTAGTVSASGCPSGPPATTTAHYTGLADGTQTFEVLACDSSYDASPITTRTFIVDTQPPSAFDLVTPADGDTTDATPTLTWKRATDSSKITYQVVLDGQKVDEVAETDPSCGADTCSVKLTVKTGTHTWSVAAADSADPPHTTASSTTRRFTALQPPNAVMTASPNPVLIGRPVQLDASGSADSTHTITKYEWDLDGDGTFETDTGTTGTTATAFPRTGTYTVKVRVTDGAGETATASQDIKVNDPTPAGTHVGVSINKGAQYTNKPDVILTVVPPSGATGLLISNDGGFADSFPQALAGEVPWKLDSSGPERLPKTVYLRFLFGTFPSPNYTDDIILDERPPVVDAASVVGAPPSTSAASAARLKAWKVKVKAHDTNSGVGGVQITLNKRKPGKLLRYASKETVKLAARPKFIRAKDRAGNFSPWKKLR